MRGTLPFEQRKSRLLVKKEATTSPKYGKKPGQRTIEEMLQYGVVNIDKPRGPTSHQVASYVQKILGLKKAGHSGTLDPNVTGVLPIAFGRATRITQGLLVAGKEYLAIMHLHDDREEQAIRNVFAAFTGTIDQLPPVRSSVKREMRERNIYYLDMLEMDGREVLFRVGCQAGTYIRKFVWDMGLKLGTKAHMAELRRTKAGPFNETTLVTLQDLADAYWFYQNEGKEQYLRSLIQQPEAGVQHLPKVYLLDSAVNSVCHGADLKVPGISALEEPLLKGAMVALLSLKGELIALGTGRMSSREILQKDKGLAVKTEKVFMQPGTYPRMEQ